jgi:phosphoribosylanthranilate isomerase
MKIKICGITNLEDALLAKKLGVDMLGFVFAGSPRKIIEQKAYSILKKLSKSIKKCAVFVNEKEEAVRKIQKKLKFDFLQFHGDESPEYCDSFIGIAKIIKAFRLKNLESIKDALDYDVDIYLFDTFVKDKYGVPPYKYGVPPYLYGGTGKLINLTLAKKLNYLLKKPIMISGGLNPDNVVSITRVQIMIEKA